VSSFFSHKRLSTPERSRLLRQLADRARERSSRGPSVLVFDLDGTLMDNRPRVAAILRELAEAWRGAHPAEATACAQVEPSGIVYGFVENLRRLGVTDPALHEEGFAFWRARFFGDHHVRHDIEVRGACDYVRTCHRAGATIVYLTGRDLPNMALGSFASLRDLGFPIGMIGTELVTKPSFEQPDAEFKQEIAPELARLGDVIGVFDNEPMNCNLLLDAHPGSTAVLLDTQHAPNPPPLDPRVHVIHTFELDP
jgi:hypothetical protein